MIFSSFIFLFAFLPVTLAAYYRCPPRGRHAVLLAASLSFYSWGAPRFGAPRPTAPTGFGAAQMPVAAKNLAPRRDAGGLSEGPARTQGRSSGVKSNRVAMMR
jgi:hypothetical protein